MSDGKFVREWDIKYRPETVDTYVFQNKDHKLKFLRMIEDRSIPHLLLTGRSGTGKTTLAKILINEMNVDDMDIKFVDASRNNKVDMIRDEITSFIQSYSASGMQIVHLEECDRLTPGAQDSLRNLMEEYEEHVRFILTCNHKHKITPALRSRCHDYDFKASDKNDIAEIVAGILIKEKVKFDLDVVDNYIDAKYPDIRTIIQTLQENVFDGELLNFDVTVADVDYKIEMMELLEGDKWTEMRILLCSNVSNDEWESVYRFLYENLHKSNKFDHVQDKLCYEQGMVVVANHLHQHVTSADPEINAAAMFIRLGQLGEQNG